MTGADYYVAPPNNAPEDLEDCLRLEVSGVDRGPETAIRQRLRAKLVFDSVCGYTEAQI